MSEDLPTIPFTASLARRLEEASEVLKNHKGLVRIISHYDPDGIAAAAVGSLMIKRLGLKFHTTLVKKLDDARVQEIRESTPEDQLLIFSDNLPLSPAISKGILWSICSSRSGNISR